MKLYKKNLIENIRFDEHLKVGEDALFNVQISEKIKKAVYLKENLYNYRINTESVVKKFDKEYSNKYLKSMLKMKKCIYDKYSNDSEVLQNFYNYVAFHVMLIAVNYCYNPDNKEKNKTKLLSKVCKDSLFEEGIKKSNYKTLSCTRKITLFTLKHRLYLLTSLICRIRQKQNRRT